jgi:hypothetical protein
MGMKRIFLDKENDLNAIHDSQRKEVLFFANRNILFFNYLPAALVPHLVLPRHTNPILHKTKKALLLLKAGSLTMTSTKIG